MNTAKMAAVATAALAAMALSGCGSDHAAPHLAAASHSVAARGLAPVSQSVSANSVRRVSFRCKSPSGQYLNISYQPSWTTTFYFNNHCSQRRHIVVKQKDWPETYTFTVNAHTKGQKKIYTGHNTAITVTST